MTRILLLLTICVLVGPDQAVSTVRRSPAAPTIAADEKLPSQAEFDALAKANKAVDCFKASVLRYRQEVKTLHAKMTKQERIGRRIRPQETIDVWYRTDPHTVLMRWDTEPAGQADGVLYIEGANNNQMWVHPKGAIARRLVGDLILKDPEGPEAKAGGRVSARKSGPLKAAEETLAKWQQAEKDGELKVEYLGIRTVDEIKRKCHVFRRQQDNDEEGIATAEIGLDVENWMQVMSVLKDSRGHLLGQYFFKIEEINPKVPEGLFEKNTLIR